MSESSSFDFNAFFQESKETLLNPKAYFPSMKLSGGMSEPLVKVVIYGAVAGILAFLWSIIGLAGVGGIFGTGIGIMALVWTIIAAIVGLFIGAVIIMIISSVCKGKTDFEACMRVVAAAMVVMPVNALLGFAMGINITLGVIVSLAVNLYALYLLYHGLTGSLGANQRTARTVMYILAALLLIFSLTSIGARNKMSRLLDDIHIDQSLD